MENPVAIASRFASGIDTPMLPTPFGSGTDTLTDHIHQTDADADRAIPFRFSRIFVMAWAAMAAVPRVDTVD